MEDDIYELMYKRDPYFRQFVKAQEEKTTEEIAEEFGIILSQNCPDKIEDALFY